MKKILYSQILDTRGMAYHAGSYGEAPDLVRRQRQQRKIRARAFIVVFHRKE